MIVQPTEFATYVYPFVDDLAHAAMQDRIAIHHDGHVVWSRETWTPESWCDFLAKMNAAMIEAFKIQYSREGES